MIDSVEHTNNYDKNYKNSSGMLFLGQINC